LRVLGLRNGNGLRATIVPGRVKNAAEDGSLKSNGPGEKLRISSKK
jgi:hypothetical protein